MLNENIQIGTLCYCHIIHARKHQPIICPEAMYLWIMDMWSMVHDNGEPQDRIQKLVQKIDTGRLGNRKVGEMEDVSQEYLDFVAGFVDVNGMFKVDKARKYMKKTFPKRMAEFECVANDKRVYDDLKVQYFYEEIMENYPDFYESMLAAGVDESRIHHPMEESGSIFRNAYRRAQMRMDLRAKKQLCDNLAKGDTTSVNAYLRIREKEDLREEPVKNDTNPLDKMKKKKKKEEKPVKINEDIKIEMPDDSPTWETKGVNE